MSSKNNEQVWVIPNAFEILMYKAEKAKRFKQGILWKNHKELISSEKIVYNKKDKLLIRELLFNPMPAEFRGKYWLIISGAKQEIINNPGYYNKLKKLAKIAPNFPYKKSISLDLRRTFPSIEYFKKQENLDKLRDILQAFSLRNSISIGYCQGFNFIVAQILLVLDDEEQTFWVFTKILEDFLPLDFYLKFSGVRIDMSLAQSIISKTLVFINKNEGLTLCINNLISRCFISLYSETLEIDVLRNIWDAFFIYGEIVLYRAFIWIAYLFCDNTLKNKDVEAVNEYIDNKMRQTNDSNNLNYFLFMYDGINNNKLKQWKKMIENSVEKETFKGSNNSKKDIKCDKSMPYCLYNKDNEDIKKQSRFIIHKMNHKIELDDNYFDDINNKDNKNINNNINNDIINVENNNELNISQDSLLIQRQKHCCP